MMNDKQKLKSRKIIMTYDEYLAILCGMNEIDNLIMFGFSKRSY